MTAIEISDPALMRRIENVARWYGMSTEQYVSAVLSIAIDTLTYTDCPNLLYLNDLD